MPSGGLRNAFVWVILALIALPLINDPQSMSPFAYVLAQAFGFAILIAVALFLFVCADVLIQDLKKPSYTNLLITERGIEFQLLPSYAVEIITWDSISRIAFSRSMSMDYKDESWSSWCIWGHDDQIISINDESHSRVTFLFAVPRHLSGFHRLRALCAILSFRRGNWICFEAKGVDVRGNSSA